MDDPQAPIRDEPLGPVHPGAVGSRDPQAAPSEGIGLCLSGGGYRAMLFHVGALWRLNELGYLSRLSRVSSVSGGSITAAVLGLRWGRLGFGGDGRAASFEAEIVAPLRAFADRTIDVPAIAGGIAIPGQTISGRIASFYRGLLFGGATLQDLPDPPRFVINATSLQTGALFRFSKPYLWDHRVGEVENPTTPLATAVAASSAFPPFLSPATLTFAPGAFQPSPGADLGFPPYTTKLRLSDGGVYDNLGLETAWQACRTILVSDGGGHLKDAPRPAHDWLLQSFRVTSVIDNQVRSLRKQQVIDGYRAGLRDGAFWGIRGHVADYPLADPLPCPPDSTKALAAVKTRLARIPAEVQERLINWGYAICDTAMRAHVEQGASPGAFPYPGGVG
jgi:NTE family protein